MNLLRYSVVVVFVMIAGAGCNADSSPTSAGNLISSQWLSTLTQAQIDQYKAGYAAQSLPTAPIDFVTTNSGTKTMNITIPASLNGVTFYKISYETVDINGNPTPASGEIILPASFASGATIPTLAPSAVLSYQHGTVTDRAEAPSADQSDESLINAFYFASRGYIVVAADYLGLGDSTGGQLYLNAQTEASASRDMLRASKLFLAQNRISTSGKLFLAGYSQGGHSTVALQQLLENDSTHEFNPTASAPMAGPYNLSATAKEVIGNPYPYVTSAEIAFMVNALNVTYNILPDLTQAIQAPYAAEFPSLFDGTHSLTVVAQSMPASPVNLLQPAVLTAITNTDTTSPVVQELIKNNLYSFVPRTPTLLLGGGGDREVPFDVNAQFTFNAMNAAHGNVVDLVKIGTLDHPYAIVPAFLYTQEWFDTLK
jgi:pimeloyl-ACP methyl ester carboxylesterase